jgi:hypothetical protein
MIFCLYPLPTSPIFKNRKWRRNSLLKKIRASNSLPKSAYWILGRNEFLPKKEVQHLP